MKQLLSEFASAINAEITLLEREGRDQVYELLSGQREEKSTGTLYIFVLADTLRLPEEATGTLKVDSRELSANVVSQEGNRIWLLLESLEPLPEYIPSARLVIDETALLKRLKEKIEALIASSEFGLAPKVFGFEPATTGSVTLTTNLGERLGGQGKMVLQQCIGSEVTFVWGPPGTGKTFTIAALVASLAASTETVLVTSHTHAAVEQALYEVVEPPSGDRQAGFLYGNPLIEEGRILKIGPLRSEKIPPSVHLDSYIEKKAKEREDSIRILEEERERISQQLQGLKAPLAFWVELEQAELAHHRSQDKLKSASATKDAAVARVTSAKADLDKYGAELSRAQTSFFIGRRGRVQKSFNTWTSARQALTRAEATAGQAEADTIRAARALGEAHARLLESRQATQDLKPYAELKEEIAAAEARIATLVPEIEALRTAKEDDAKQLVNNAIAIFATLTKLYVDRELLPDVKWDTVIIDEVSMAMPPLLAYAASRAKRRVVLVGDMYQLPPVVSSPPDSAGAILGTDIFEMRGITDIIDKGKDVPQLAKLIKQRRMHPDIATGAKVLIDRYKHLETDNEVLVRRRPEFLSAIGIKEALAVIDIRDLNPWSGKMPGSLSRFNFISGQVAVELSVLYAAQLDKPDENAAPPIGIVTPYAAQRRYLSRLIQNLGLERWVAAGTVHTFQGNECEVVIFDSVVGEPHWTSRFTNPTDWAKVRRDLNVALTRARHQFIFVADIRWLKKYAKAGTGYGKLWAFLEKGAAKLNVTDIVGHDFKERLAQTVAEVKGWDIKSTKKTELLTETEFYGKFTTDLMQATNRVVLYTPFIGKTRWLSVAPFIAVLRERNIEVFLLHKPLTDPEWKHGDREFGRSVFDSLARLGVKLIPVSGLHAKTIVIDGKVVYEGSLNWASQTSSYEHMWRFESSDMAKLVEKMLQLDPIISVLEEEKAGNRCPKCGGSLILINQAKQSPTDHYPLKWGCARWHEDKRTCSGYLRRVDGRIPFLEPPVCTRGTRMWVKYTKDGRPWDWRCGHKGCRPIRWVSGDCLN
jgi:hypothetical protein